MQVTEEDLRAEFGAFGEIAGLKPCHKGGYGFVTFRDHSAAVQAIVGMNGKDLKGKVSQSLHAVALIALVGVDLCLVGAELPSSK